MPVRYTSCTVWLCPVWLLTPTHATATAGVEAKSTRSKAGKQDLIALL
jgi:hypothetical protein